MKKLHEAGKFLGIFLRGALKILFYECALQMLREMDMRCKREGWGIIFAFILQDKPLLILVLLDRFQLSKLSLCKGFFCQEFWFYISIHI